jgi:methylenetetrahydrofolate reductase (NADPH)
MSFKKSLFNPDEFTITFELVPNRGGSGKGQNRILNLAQEAAADERIQAVSITENAGGHPALSPEVLGLEIQAMGLPVISHFSCKDKNRNQMESLLFGWDRVGLRNLLVLSGDYPQQGYLGKPKPVFDLDSVQALDLISQMNQGNTKGNPKIANFKFQPTSFLKGVAVSPFKILPQELILQYAKLHRKVAAGADYIITQLGFDARKFQEILLYLQRYDHDRMRMHKLNLPVLGNVFIPNLTVAKLMYQGDIPGCIVSEDLYTTILAEAKSDDKGKKSRLIRAAKLLAILKGLGYAGAHIGGPGLTFSDLDLVMTEAENMQDDWRSLLPDLSYWPKEGCYFFEADPDSGLNLAGPQVRFDSAQRAVDSQDKVNNIPKSAGPSYHLSHWVHQTFFEPTGTMYEPASKICLGLERCGHENFLMRVEYLIKLALFGCQNCGDCRLADLAYLCPQSGCAKYMLNGPCGGSRDGWCEVYPNRKRCFWVLVYNRLKPLGLAELLQTDFQPPRDWSKNNTSSWLSFFKDQNKKSD